MDQTGPMILETIRETLTTCVLLSTAKEEEGELNLGDTPGRWQRGQNPAVYIETHGCKLNQADSQALALRFAQVGYRLVDAPGQADVHVVNTCTVTHVADRKARQALRSARRTNPAAVVVATGCYAQRL